MTSTYTLAVILSVAAMPALGQSPTNQTAETVTVLVFVDGDQTLDPCTRVTHFRRASGTVEEFASHFEGCVGRSIAYGSYDVGVTSISYETTRYAGAHGFKCLIDQPDAVCIIHVDGADLFERTLTVKVHGAPTRNQIILRVSSSFYDWTRFVSVDSRGQASIESVWDELIITLYANGVPAGAITVDRGYRNRRSTEVVTNVVIGCVVAAGRIIAIRRE